MARQYGASGRGGRKKSTAQLKAENAGVKDGTIRKGKGGKTVRRYNAKTGRWEILRVIDKKGRTKATKKTSKPSDTSNPPSQNDSSKPDTSKGRVEGLKRSMPRKKQAVIDPLGTRKTVRNRPERGVPMRLTKERERKGPLKYVTKPKYRWVKVGK